ncbi:MAG: bifunctional DNA primase/polymerase [Planctomycetota bacterium]
MSTATKNQTIRDLAQGYLAGGISLVPINHTSKLPAFGMLPDGKWGHLQTEAATAETVDQWFARGCKAVAAVCGEVSGGLLVIDFDEARFFDSWWELVNPLPEGVAVQKTGREGGGYQVALRCENPGKNAKLAFVPDETQEDGRKCAIETKAEGGYAVLPGSLHPSGRLYECISGDFAEIGTVPQAVADALLEAARSLDEEPLTRKQKEAAAAASLSDSTVEKLRRLKEEIAECNGKTCDKHEAESNGEVSVIEEYNKAVTIEAELLARKYTKYGDRYKRPGGVHGSVTIKEGRSFHHSTNDALCDGYWHRPFDVFCAIEHDGKCKEAVKAAALKLGIKPKKDAQAKAQAAPGGTEGDAKEPLPFTQLLTGAELLGLDLRQTFLIKGVLAVRQPMIIGGRSKTLKTSIGGVDLNISLGSGTPFLGRFESQKVVVGFWSGESGAATIRETAKRVAAARGVDLAKTLTHWNFDLPKLCNLAHLDALEATIKKYGIEVAIIDPLYLALMSPETASGASNIFLMGSLLQGLTKLGQKTNCTIVLLHHFRKGGAPNEDEPAGLEELSQSGVAEWARQWMLFQRRCPYRDDGNHALWMRCGGSAGHSSLWGVNIDEGTIDPDTGEGRRWEVSVSPHADARQEAQQDKENRKAADQEKREAEFRARLLSVLKTVPDGETERALTRAAGMNTASFGKAIFALIQEGRVVMSKITKNGATYDGYKPTGK